MSKQVNIEELHKAVRRYQTSTSLERVIADFQLRDLAPAALPGLLALWRGAVEQRGSGRCVPALREALDEMEKGEADATEPG